MNADVTTIPAPEIDVRIAGLQQRMAQQGVDGALIVQKTDLFYYSGTGQQGWLYVPVAGKPLLFIFKEYERARRESPIDDIVSLASAKKIPRQLQDAGVKLPEVLGLELDVLPTNLYFQYAGIFPESRTEDISPLIRLQRAVKSEFEISKLRRAGKLADKVAAHAAELIRPGRTEIEVAGALEAYARSLGHQGIVRMRMWGGELFYGHLLSGAGAAVPSYLASPTGGEGVSTAIAQGAGFRKIHRNEPVLVDYVFARDGYLADQTRIFCCGTIADELRAAHHGILEMQEMVKEWAKPGVVCGEIYTRMVAAAEKIGYGEYFMGVGERRIRFTGHGIGLELDEFPFIAAGQKLPLAAGMVLALEPKIILPGKGVVGIENTHLVTATGLETLTNYPDEITVIAM
jgi:Xaa-Pro dipeptidase